MSKKFYRAVNFSCANDCRMEGCPGHELQVANNASANLYEVFIDGYFDEVIDENRLHAIFESLKTENIEHSNFQSRTKHWTRACFGESIASDKVERNHRFLEEALELVQSLGCTASEAHQLVDYVFNRPVGETNQELGGTMVTLAALSNANGLDMINAAEIELARCWTKLEQIREKQKNKPKHSPLPA